MGNLKNEIRICHKIHNKVTMTLYFYYEIGCIRLYVQVQGVPHWNVSFKLALRDRNMRFRFCLKVSVYFWDYGIWVSSTTFQESNMGLPQQPPTEMVPYVSESLDFDKPFHKKWSVLVILMPLMIKPLGSGSFLRK